MQGLGVDIGREVQGSWAGRGREEQGLVARRWSGRWRQLTSLIHYLGDLPIPKLNLKEVNGICFSF